MVYVCCVRIQYMLGRCSLAKSKSNLPVGTVKCLFVIQSDMVLFVAVKSSELLNIVINTHTNSVIV